MPDSASVRLVLPPAYAAAMRAVAPSFRVAQDSEYIDPMLADDPPSWATVLRSTIAIGDLDRDGRAEVLAVGYLDDETVALVALLPRDGRVAGTILHQQRDPRPPTIEETLASPLYRSMPAAEREEARLALERMAELSGRFRLADGRPKLSRRLSEPFPSRGRAIQYQDGDCKDAGWIWTRPVAGGPLRRKRSPCRYGD